MVGGPAETTQDDPRATVAGSDVGARSGRRRRRRHRRRSNSDRRPHAAVDAGRGRVAARLSDGRNPRRESPRVSAGTTNCIDRTRPSSSSQSRRDRLDAPTVAVRAVAPNAACKHIPPRRPSPAQSGRAARRPCTGRRYAGSRHTGRPSSVRGFDSTWRRRMPFLPSCPLKGETRACPEGLHGLGRYQRDGCVLLPWSSPWRYAKALVLLLVLSVLSL